MQECLDKMAESLDTIAAVDADTVDNLCAGLELRQPVKQNPNSRMGYERAGYCEGYKNISVKTVKSIATEHVGNFECELFDRRYSIKLITTERSLPTINSILS